MLEYKLDFTVMQGDSVRQTMVFLPSALLSSGYYTDLGFRYVLNIFVKNDAWVPYFIEPS